SGRLFHYSALPKDVASKSRCISITGIRNPRISWRRFRRPRLMSKRTVERETLKTLAASETDKASRPSKGFEDTAVAAALATRRELSWWMVEYGFVIDINVAACFLASKGV